MDEKVYISTKSKKLDFLLCLFFGVFGIHRFYEGKIITGVLYLVTLGFLGWGILMDLMQIILGCRLDKQKLLIGNRHTDNGKNLKILSIIVATILWLLIVFLVVRYITDMPMVKENYYNEVNAAAKLEKKYTQLGEYKVHFVEFDSQEKLYAQYKVWYPSVLKQSNSVKLPIVIIANGTGVPFSKFSPIFEHLASWGFVVVGNDDDASWTGLSSSKSLTFILRLNEDSKSLFYHKLDVKNIGISGHSQGGVGAINATTAFPNSNRYTSIYTASATSLELANALKWKYDVTKVNIPYFMVAGTGDIDGKTITPLASLNKNFDRLNKKVPAVMARRKKADHGEMLTYADGYMTAWFRYTLMNDKEASIVFSGQHAEIAENSTNWQDVRIQNMH
ncbi:NINE protein [Paenibacillus dauci]|uniref:NINE protein n=1 Tax=Paenibacillus dauci TaxID=1567106 RepID=UPI001E2A3A09|nr:NINE protein [Paenibacillus dauci]